jgi:hypothetical protein
VREYGQLRDQPGPGGEAGSAALMAVWIGTSGWSYDHWPPELYPSGLPLYAP